MTVRDNLALGPLARRRADRPKRVGVMMAEELLRAIDERTGPRGRSAWIERACHAMLERESTSEEASSGTT